MHGVGAGGIGGDIDGVTEAEARCGWKLGDGGMTLGEALGGDEGDSEGDTEGLDTQDPR